jgi:hypothetical protein
MNLIKTDPIICIDPGTTNSGVVVFDGLNVIECFKEFYNNELVLWLREDIYYSRMVIEGIASYGMPVGESTFETVEWIGRFREAFGFELTTKIYRKDVKMFLCGSMRAKDANIRQRILDIFPATGGGKTPQIGTKKQPGPLYGVTSHAMSALALGLTFKYSEGL